MSETYEDFVRGRLAPPTPESIQRLTECHDLLHGGIGLATESGELLDVIKRHVYYGTPLDRWNLMEECGDVLFYLTAILNYLDVPLGDCLRDNQAKLRKRYPDGFSEQAAVERADKD